MPLKQPNKSDLRWAALRCLLLDILADAGEPPHLNGDREVFERLVLSGRSPRDIAIALDWSTDSVIAVLADMARSGS